MYTYIYIERERVVFIDGLDTGRSYLHVHTFISYHIYIFMYLHQEEGRPYKDFSFLFTKVSCRFGLLVYR